MGMSINQLDTMMKVQTTLQRKTLDHQAEAFKQLIEGVTGGEDNNGGSKQSLSSTHVDIRA